MPLLGTSSALQENAFPHGTACSKQWHTHSPGIPQLHFGGARGVDGAHIKLSATPTDPRQLPPAARALANHHVVLATLLAPKPLSDTPEVLV
jgi:hypothetical protein